MHSHTSSNVRVSSPMPRGVIDPPGQLRNCWTISPVKQIHVDDSVYEVHQVPICLERKTISRCSSGVLMCFIYQLIVTSYWRIICTAQAQLSHVPTIRAFQHLPPIYNQGFLKFDAWICPLRAKLHEMLYAWLFWVLAKWNKSCTPATTSTAVRR